MSDGAIDAHGRFNKDNTVAPGPASILSLFSLKGKTAIVTGAGAGIGLSIAHALAEAGADVAIWYHGNKKAIQEASDIEKKYGVRCVATQVNVTDEADVSRAVDDNVKELNGRLDVFVANAGIPWTAGAALDADVNSYHKIIATDLDSVYYCARAAARHFRRQKFEGTSVSSNGLNGEHNGSLNGALNGTSKLQNYTYGSFIATSSMSAHIVNIPQLQAAYNAAKAGVSHLCKSLAVEWVKFARVNAVSPGYIATELTHGVPEETKDIWRSKIPMGREGTADELRGAFLYLASDASSYTTGADLVCDGGYLLP